MADTSDDAKPDNSDEGILALAKERFNLCVENESDLRKLGKEDAEFSIGDQWPEELKKAYQAKGKPLLTINKITTSIHQLTNDQRQNRQAIKVSPVDDKADIDTAKVIQGVIRHIEYNSNADVAYDRSFDGAVRRSYGFMRVVTDYCDDRSFNQEIMVRSVLNPDTCYLGPHQEPDGSDANYGFAFEELSKADFKAQYPDSTLDKMDDWSAPGGEAGDWITKDGCRIADYYFKTFKRLTIVQLSDGSVVEKPKSGQILQPGVTVLPNKERDVIEPAIKHYKINGVEVLEKTDWAGKWIPIVPVYGEEVSIGGKITRESLVRNAKDPQRMYNYFASAETEAVALAPKAPFVMAEGQDEGHEQMWATANTENYSTLIYKPTSLNGVPMPPPQRNVVEPAVQAITQGRMLASDDIKATTGLFDAALGNQSNENSGIAIQRRANQSQTGNFHFLDNLSRSRRHLGRIIIDLIPHIYDTPQMLRTIGEDGTPKMVAVNQQAQNPNDKSHYLNVGKYDVTVSTGASYQTKRQEAVESMIELTKVAPQVGQIAADLMIRNMDIPYAEEIADRIKKTLPPGIAKPEEGEQAPLPPEVQQQMQQMQQHIQQSDHALHDAMNQMDEFKATIDQKRQELESKERIELMKIQATAAVELAKLGNVAAIAGLKHDAARIEAQLDRDHMAQAQDMGFQQSAFSQQQDQAHQAQMQQATQAQAAEQAEAQRQHEQEQNRISAASLSQPTGGASPGDQGETE